MSSFESKIQKIAQGFGVDAHAIEEGPQGEVELYRQGKALGTILVPPAGGFRSFRGAETLIDYAELEGAVRHVITHIAVERRGELVILEGWTPSAGYVDVEIPESDVQRVLEAAGVDAEDVRCVLEVLEEPAREARCTQCGETFVPTGEEGGDLLRPEHYETAAGNTCGGAGEVTA